MKRDTYIGILAFTAGGLFIELTLDFIGLGLVGVGLYYIITSAIRDASPKPQGEGVPTKS
ncbi:MAG: hypothetical protein E6K96_00965 [Thaumarchaeota archaeon]|nr:MAG: hypothetical protein E6K96_00965 [Nitrososphaerota archaeon]